MNLYRPTIASFEIKFRYSKILEEGYNVNMFSLFKRFMWPAIQSAIDGSVESFNGLSGEPYYWRRWHQICVAIDMINGKVFTNYNGVEDGSSNHKPKMFLDPIQRANNKIKNPNIVTDALFGCHITEDIAGKC